MLLLLELAREIAQPVRVWGSEGESRWRGSRVVGVVIMQSRAAVKRRTTSSSGSTSAQVREVELETGGLENPRRVVHLDVLR